VQYLERRKNIHMPWLRTVESCSNFDGRANKTMAMTSLGNIQE